MIIGSEERMGTLLNLFDASIEEIEKLEATLDAYDRKLSVRSRLSRFTFNSCCLKHFSDHQRLHEPDELE